MTNLRGFSEKPSDAIMKDMKKSVSVDTSIPGIPKIPGTGRKRFDAKAGGYRQRSSKRPFIGSPDSKAGEETREMRRTEKRSFGSSSRSFSRR